MGTFCLSAGCICEISLFRVSCVSLTKMGGTHVARAIGDAANADENIPVMEIIMWIGLVGLGLTFLCVIIYGVSKSCKDGSCGSSTISSSGLTSSISLQMH